MKILITGSSGFIASELIKSLSSDISKEIFGVDLCASHLRINNYHHILGDIKDKSLYKKLPHVDTIIHAAQSNKYRDFPNGSEDIVMVNIFATFSILEWARKIKVKNFIFTSTGSVYSESDSSINEQNICYPSTMYSTSKYSAELLINQYSQFFKITILRLFGVFGPSQKKMLVPNIIERVKNNQKIILSQNVGITLSMIYIDDCVQIIHLLVDKWIHSEHLYNISSDEIITLKDIVLIVQEQTGRMANIEIDYNKPKRIIADVSLIKSFLPDLSFNPIHDGIIKTVQSTIKK